MVSKSLPPCPYCGFAAINDYYALMTHMESRHSTFEWLDNGLAESGAEEPMNSVGDFVHCPKEDCRETILLADLEAHLDLHGAGTMNAGGTKEFADAYCSNITAESNQPLKTHFGGNLSDKFSNYDGLQDSSLLSRRKDKGRDRSFLNDPSSREQSFKPAQAAGSAYQRLGEAELGPYAFENQMPTWLRNQLEGGRVTTGNKTRADSTSRREDFISNETWDIVPLLAQLCEQDKSIEQAFLCHPGVKHIMKMPGEEAFTGYQNIQMLISYIQAAHSEGFQHFQGGLPTVLRLQDLIEEAWDEGINSFGRIETGGIRGTRKYIGTPEAQALFISLRIPCEATSFRSARKSKELLQSIQDYFTAGSYGTPTKVQQTMLPPLYLQHPGYSLTVVGFEKRKTGTRNLLVFDPDLKPSSHVRKVLGRRGFKHYILGSMLSVFRKGEFYLRRFTEFELLQLLPPTSTSTSALVNFRNNIPITTSSVITQEPAPRMPLSPTSVGSEQTAGLRQLMKPFDVSKLSHMPFTGRDISPSNTQDELLDFTQQLINFSTRGIPPPTATWMNTPHDVDERQASSVALVELVDAAPISSTPLMAPTPPAEPALHSNVPVVPLDTLLSQASMYLVKPPKEINKHARPSHLQPEKEPETRAIGVFGGYIEVPAASTAPTGAWESSDEAIWKFPPAEGMAGIENPEGMAHIRLKNMKDKRCMGLGMGILNRERVEREELFRLGELFMKVLQGEQVETFSQNEALCTECASLMLTPENFLPKGPYSDRIPREWREPLFDFAFTKLRDSETCPLCWLMRYALETACHADAIDSDRLHCTLFMTHFSAFWDNEMRYESFRFLTVVGKEPGSNCSEITVDLLPVETKQYPLTFIGRLVQPDKISPGLVRRWLQQCEQVHGPNCSRLDFGYNADLRSAGPPSQHESRFSNLVQSLYFVDVRENCLRTLSTPDRYLALSYVWGASKSPFTIKVNLHDRLKPNGLLAIRDQLPAVIVDAMTLTKDIGERYLWVDSLCIVQDDDETKQRAISKMDIVYENALLVIISAAGANADTGLPGVKPNTRRETQVSATIARDLRLIVPHTLRALDHSIWASRAWTFQEHCFSKRRIIFLNGQVTFKCGWDAPSREDILSELQIAGMEDYTYKLPNGALNGIHTAIISGNVSRQFSASLIEEYSGRQLTYQSDILNAFAGIADKFRADFDTEFCFGLAKPTLGLALLWQSGFLERRTGFPSWSWVGWIGKVVMGISITDKKWIGKYSWIYWYLFDSTEGNFRLLPQQATQPENDRVTPEFLGLLHRHRQRVSDTRVLSSATDQARSPSATRGLMDLGFASSDFDLPHHTILFQTVKGRVWMSAYDPSGCAKENTTHVHLYDDSFRYLGVAWVNDLTFWAQSGIFADYKTPKHPTWRKFPVDIAFLSGPEKATVMTQKTYVWPRIGPAEGFLSPDSAKFYRVMLLSRWSIANYKPLQRTYERVGLGEVRADMAESWEALSWEDVLLQ